MAGPPSAIPGITHVIDTFYRETGGNIVNRYLVSGSWLTNNVVGADNATSDVFALKRDSSNIEVFYWYDTDLMDANWNTGSQSWSTSPINL